MKCKITTTKKVFFTTDKAAIASVRDYYHQIDFGKKPKLPFFTDVKIIVNPQYVILMEFIEDDSPKIDTQTFPIA